MSFGGIFCGNQDRCERETVTLPTYSDLGKREVLVVVNKSSPVTGPSPNDPVLMSSCEKATIEGISLHSECQRILRRVHPQVDHAGA